MDELKDEFIATAVSLGDGAVHLSLTDGSTHSFPVHYFPRLRQASPAQLEKVALRVGGRALRWEELDEDIWIADAILQKYPASRSRVVADPDRMYRKGTE